MNERGNCGEKIAVVYELTKRTHEKNVRRLGTIIQSIFCAQSGASIHLTVWKWSGESRCPWAFRPVLENFRRAFSPGPTDCPWVSEDANHLVKVTSHYRNAICITFSSYSLSSTPACTSFFGFALSNFRRNWDLKQI